MTAKVTMRKATVLALAVATGCSLPTDEQPDLGVGFLADEVDMVVGELLELPVEVSGSGDVASLDVALHSQDESVVRPAGSGSLRAVGVGETRVEVFLAAFAGARTDTLRVRVMKDISFEAVRPDTVSFGDVVTVAGSALDPQRLSALGVGGWEALVHSFVPADTNDPASRDTLRLWVPPGAPVESRIVALHGAGGTASWPITVRQGDLWEPNDSVPARIAGARGLDNPQLAFETGNAYDWYRLRELSGDFTLAFQAGFPVEGVQGDFELAAPRAARGDAPEWSVTYYGAPRCRGLEARRVRSIFLDDDQSRKTFLMPVMNPPADSLDVIVQMFAAPAEPRAYSVRVLDGYQSDLDPDPFEPNNHCGQAYPVTDGFEGPLTLDHGLDMDWFRFSVDESLSLTVRFECPECAFEFHWLDINLFRDSHTGTSEAPDELPLVASSDSPEDVQTLRATVDSGDYFLLVHNEFSDPVRELTISVTLR
jgi:hypothetical protein